MTEVPEYLSKPPQRPRLVTPTPATPKTIGLLRIIAQERQVSKHVRSMIDIEIDNGISQYRAGEWIDFLHTLPRRLYGF